MVTPTGELEGYGWVGAPPSMCSVVNRVMSVPSRYFWTARTVRPAYRGQQGGEREGGIVKKGCSRCCTNQSKTQK